MANNLSLPAVESYRPEFEDRYDVEFQQVRSRSIGLCDQVAVNGEYREFPLANKTDSISEITDLYGETSPDVATFGKRRVTTSPYKSPLIFDRVTEKKFGTGESQIPVSIANQKAEAARHMDKIIVGEAGKNGGLLGNAIEVAANGVVSYPAFDSTYTIPVNYDFAAGATGADKGMSYDKLMKLRTELSKLDVMSQDGSTNNPSPFGLILSSDQVLQLLQDEKIRNRDQASAQLEQVASGILTDCMGFTMSVDDTNLPEAAGVKTCVAFHKGSVKFGYNEMPVHELDRLPTKNHSVQSVFYWDWGFSRIWDKGVFKVPCIG